MIEVLESTTSGISIRFMMISDFKNFSFSFTFKCGKDFDVSPARNQSINSNEEYSASLEKFEDFELLSTKLSSFLDPCPRPSYQVPLEYLILTNLTNFNV